jgi:D-amino-acid dehydrogenase
MRYDIIVLGAGMVGISAALHLQARGRSVALVDRRAAAEETSYGNAGIIQREGVVPYAFPRDFGRILSYALNRSPEANIHWRALPWLAPFLYRYWRAGSPEGVAATAKGARPLVERCIPEHDALLADAGVSHLVRRTGYLKVFRDPAKLAAEVKADDFAQREYGVTFEVVDPGRIQSLEPHLSGRLAGGVFMPQPTSVSDPGAVGKAYADLFVKRGGTFVTGDAMLLEATADGWRLPGVEGAIEAGIVVLALGPWTGRMLARLGVNVPFGVKRGYHVHIAPSGNATLSRPVVDGENGFVMTAMTRGIRITSGAEFARFGAPPTPVQIRRVEPLARSLLPLAERIPEPIWLGNRPCVPDMLPIIGAVPGRRGLWVDTGHHHLGFTLGPVSGRLLAELICGEAPFTDSAPYRIDRFD